MTKMHIFTSTATLPQPTWLKLHTHRSKMTIKIIYNFQHTYYVSGQLH